MRDIEVHSVKRKQSFNESTPGVVIAKLKSVEDKKRVMARKASLKDNRRFQNIYIHNDQTREERLMSANFRSLLNAYKNGDNNIRVRGARIVTDITRTEIENMEVDVRNCETIDDDSMPSYRQSSRHEEVSH